MKTLLVCLALIGCSDPPPPRPDAYLPRRSDFIQCKVVRFSAAELAPTCMIECGWAKERGVAASSTPVSCDWYGKEVTRQ